VCAVNGGRKGLDLLPEKIRKERGGESLVHGRRAHQSALVTEGVGASTLDTDDQWETKEEGTSRKTCLTGGVKPGE